jgi:hypothetical protein
MTTSNPTDPIIDLPGDHGFFMFGDKVLYLSHMPMFTVEKHMYQVVLRVTLPDEVMRPYRADRFASAWNLTNTDDVFTLPQIKDGSLTSYSVDVFRDYSNADAAPIDPPLAKDVTLQVDEVLHFRHFDVDIPRPDHLTYLLFGRDGEAHLSHYITRDPDFQHIVTLGVVPNWLSADQLAAGVLVNLADQPSLPTPCQNPLTMASCPVLYQGRPDAPATLDLSGATTVWFSTGNMLNATDPCVPTVTS